MKKLGFKRLKDLPGVPPLFSGIDSWDWNTRAPSEAGEAINCTGPKIVKSSSNPQKERKRWEKKGEGNITCFEKFS